MVPRVVDAVIGEMRRGVRADESRVFVKRAGLVAGSPPTL